MPSDADFGEQLESRTDVYLDRLQDCIGLLPELLEQYAAGGEYRETVAQIGEIESELDEMHRDIMAALTNAEPADMGLLNTRINANQSALVEFYNRVDTMANVTERIANELDMMQPPHDTDSFRGLAEMAAEVVAMLEDLEDVIERFIHNLGRVDSEETLTEGIQSIRDAESRCDAIKNDVIANAFADADIDMPLLYREFAILFDDLANTAEDVTDQIIVIASNESGIVTELGSDAES
ncbi:MAG: DUF47 domain-containing protein [Halovenus sp.]